MLLALALAAGAGDDALRLEAVHRRLVEANPVECVSGCGTIDVEHHNEVGAWAYPDGTIGVQSNFMRALSDDALAFVIGHEIAHLRGFKSERAADAEGLRMAIRAGYDAAAIQTFAGMLRRGMLSRIFK